MRRAWNITVQNNTENVWAKDPINLFVTAGSIMDTVKLFSESFPGHRVVLSTMARNRLVMVDGEVVQSVDSLTHFYTNVDSQDDYDWMNIQEFMREESE